MEADKSVGPGLLDDAIHCAPEISDGRQNCAGHHRGWRSEGHDRPCKEESDHVLRSVSHGKRRSNALVHWSRRLVGHDGRWGQALDHKSRCCVGICWCWCEKIDHGSICRVGNCCMTMTMTMTHSNEVSPLNKFLKNAVEENGFAEMDGNRTYHGVYGRTEQHVYKLEFIDKKMKLKVEAPESDFTNYADENDEMNI